MKSSEGFSLTEIIVVMGIMGIMASLGSQVFSQQVRAAATLKAVNEREQLELKLMTLIANPASVLLSMNTHPLLAACIGVPTAPSARCTTRGPKDYDNMLLADDFGIPLLTEKKETVRRSGYAFTLLDPGSENAKNPLWEKRMQAAVAGPNVFYALDGRKCLTKKGPDNECPLRVVAWFMPVCADGQETCAAAEDIKFGWEIRQIVFPQAKPRLAMRAAEHRGVQVFQAALLALLDLSSQKDGCRAGQTLLGKSGAQTLCAQPVCGGGQTTASVDAAKNTAYCSGPSCSIGQSFGGLTEGGSLCLQAACGSGQTAERVENGNVICRSGN